MERTFVHRARLFPQGGAARRHHYYERCDWQPLTVSSAVTFLSQNSITSLVNICDADKLGPFVTNAIIGRRFTQKILSNLTGHLIDGFLKSLQVCDLKRLHTVVGESQ